MKMNQKFFGVVKKDDDIIFIGGNMDYDEYKEEDGAIVPKNYKLNINSDKLEESELPFTEYNLKEKTFLPYNENIYYIFPDFNKNHPEVIFYRKDKNKVQLVKYESQIEPEENTIVHKKIKDLPPAKINRLDFNQPKLDEKLNININPINTDNNDNNKYPEIENKINNEEIINNINDIKIDENFNNINNNINTNEININNMMEQNININNNKDNLINFTHIPENSTQIKGNYNISSNSNIFKYMDESKQIVIGSTNENNNNNINIEGADINININQNNSQNINNIEPQRNSLIEEKRSEEEKIEELSKSNIKSNNTPTENLQILDDMLKSSKYDDKKTFSNQENNFNTPQIEIKNDNNIESQNININYQQIDINLQGSKNMNLKLENPNIKINEENQNINLNTENVIKKEKENEEFCLTGIIKGTKEKEKEKKESKKESEEKKDNNLKSSTEFILTGIILGKKETDSKIIKIYNEKNKSQEKEKENKEQNDNNLNINAQLNIDNPNQNDNNNKIENPFKSKVASTDINNKIEINGNINPNPLNIEINKNTEDINKINFNFESKSPEIIGTDIKTPNQISGNINENNNIQPFDINVQNKNLEINANIDNKEKKDEDDFRLSGIIKGTKYLNIKKENKNESEENHNAPKLDINGNIVGVEVNQPKIEIEKQNQIEGNINLNGQKIISIENKEKDNNKKETKDLFCLKGIIVSKKNKKKENESDKNNLQGKSENGGIKSENQNQINININNENIQSENVAINGQKIDNE